MTEATNTMTNDNAVTAGASSTHAYFDLFEYVQGIRSTDVAAQAARSIAWRIDTLIQSAARDLFNQAKDYIKASADYTHMSAAEMNNTIADAANAEQALVGLGKNAEGPVHTIHQLMDIRGKWNALAAELVGMTVDWKGAPRVYVETDLAEMFHSTIELSIKPMTADRIKQSVTRRYSGERSADEMKVVIDKRIELEQRNLEQRADALNQQTGAVYSMYLAATQHHMQVDSDFHMLAVEVQRVLIEQALRGADNAEADACRNNSLSATEFDELLFAVGDVQKQLTAVLRSPKFTRS